MAYEEILTETQGRVGIIRLNRPQKLNAWTYTMSGEIVDQMNRWNDDDGIGAVVLTGVGRAFCAGADIGNFAERVEADREKQGEESSVGGRAPSRSSDEDSRGANITHVMRRSKPTVVAVNGYAVGVGLTMILPCDVRIASTNAQLSIRFIKMGLMPELGSTRLLAQIVGLGNAAEMCLTGRMVGAEEALRMGLVTAVAEPDDLLPTALAKAEEIADNPTSAVMMIKELLRENPMEGDLDAVMEREGVRDRIARRLPDHAEAVAAFLEKREARFNR